MSSCSLRIIMGGYECAMGSASRSEVMREIIAKRRVPPAGA